MEKGRPILDLIQFGDNLEHDVNTVDAEAVPQEIGGDATRSEEVHLTLEEADQAKRIERRLSNARQPSLESDHSVVGILYTTVVLLYGSRKYPYPTWKVCDLKPPIPQEFSV